MKVMVRNSASYREHGRNVRRRVAIAQLNYVNAAPYVYSHRTLTTCLTELTRRFA